MIGDDISVALSRSTRITINGSNTLTLNATNTGLDLSAAAQDLTLNCDLTVAADQAWNVAANRTLALAGDVLADGQTVTKAGAGTLRITGGVSTYDHLWNTGAGVLEMSGGNVTVNTWFRAAYYGNGTANLNGGSLVVNGSLMVAYGQGGSGGTLNINSNASVTATEVRMCQANDAKLNLNGGTLSAYNIMDAGGGASEFSFNGGKLRARQDRADFLQGLDHAWVRTNGAVIDAQGYAITISQPLEHDALPTNAPDGGLKKLGSGALTLTGTNTFTGPTLVSAGTLAVNGRLNGTGAVTVASGATLTGGGVIAGAVTVQGNATLSAPAGDLAMGSLALANNSILQLALGGSGNTSNAVLRVAGNLTLDGVLSVTSASALTVGASYAGIAYTGALTNRGLVLDSLSSWNIAVNTNTPGLVRFDILQQFPFVEITNGDGPVSTTTTNLTAILQGSTAKPMWFEVRDAAGQLWDYGAHAAGSPWPFNVRHLREGTNTVTVFAVMPSGQVASNSVRLTMTLGPAPAVRPRPVPAEIWWGGSCHDNLYDTNGNIRGTYSRMAQLANTNLSWDFVKRWQDGLFLHGYVWVNNIARMTNWSAAAQSISAQLAPWRGKFWLENAWRPATNINFGHSSAGGELSDEADLRGTGMVLSEMDQDFNPQAQDFALWHPDWPVLDHVAATTGDLSLAGTNYPYASGEWRDFVTDFHASAPHVQQGWVYSPVWFTGRTGPRWARTTTSSTRSATAATTSSMSPASR